MAVNVVVNSVLPAFAPIHRPVHLQKLPLFLRDPTPLLSTLNQRGEVAREPAPFCHCNEAEPRPEVSAVPFPNPLGASPFSRVPTVMENLEKSWHFKMVISRPGKVLEKT